MYNMSDSEELSFSTCVRGYHIYKDIWTPTVGEILCCARQMNNMVDRYAVSVNKIVGHFPKKFSKIFSLFLRRGGVVACEVTSTRRHSTDLVLGGLEISCLLQIKGERKSMYVLRKLLRIERFL